MTLAALDVIFNSFSKVSMIFTLMVNTVLLLASLILAAYCQYTTIAVVALNDIHGSALPTLMQRQDNFQNYTYGGLQYMASMISTIKNEFPGHTLLLDAGDQFQGGV